MQNTTYYNLKKPEGADLVDMLHFNENADIIDAELKKRAGKEVATQSTNGLMCAVDKKKLDGMEEGANAYIHPFSHPADIIIQDSNHRFATDLEKNIWNEKQDKMTIDDALSAVSTNPIQNKVINDKILSINMDLKEKQTQINNLNTMIGRISGGIGNFGSGTLVYGATASTTLTFSSTINNAVVTPMSETPMDFPMSVSWSGRILTIYVKNNHALKYTCLKNEIMYSAIAILTD